MHHLSYLQCAVRLKLLFAGICEEHGFIGAGTDTNLKDRNIFSSYKSKLHWVRVTNTYEYEYNNEYLVKLK